MLVAEYLASGDSRLLDEVFKIESAGFLKTISERFYRAARPEVRAMLLAYVDDGCDRAGHRPLIKGLLRQAEAAHDDELMTHLMVAFDRLSRRSLTEVREWDWTTRTSRKELRLLPDRALPRTADEAHALGRFSRVTRRYLQRRTLRYFRRLGFRDPARYRKTMTKALSLYQERHLDKPERLLDAWGLLHVLYGRSSVLSRRPGGITLAEGRTLSELDPAPLHPGAWQDAQEELLALVFAPARTVRTWAIAMLKRGVSLPSLSLAQLRPLLRSEHSEVQLFAVGVLENCQGLGTLPIADWMELLRAQDLEVLSTIVELVRKHVHPDRLSLEPCIELACLPFAPVAELGFAWTRAQVGERAEPLGPLLRLANAQVPAIRETAAAWLAGTLDGPAARSEDVRALIDARHEAVRRHGLQALGRVPRFRDDDTMWAALAESPHADVRAALIAILEQQEKEGVHGDARRHLWATTLLDVRRAGRIKPTVLAQIARRILHAPAETTTLLALMRTILRSVRPRERNHALVALVRAAGRRPDLVAAIHTEIPEVKLLDMEIA